MRIDVSLDGQQIYSFGAAEYQNAAALRARDGVRKEKEAVPSPFQRWALVWHVFKHWSEVQLKSHVTRLHADQDSREQTASNEWTGRH